VGVGKKGDTRKKGASVEVVGGGYLSYSKREKFNQKVGVEKKKRLREKGKEVHKKWPGIHNKSGGFENQGEKTQKIRS